MALIRSADAQTLTRDAIVLDLGELSRQAKTIIAHAKAEAERIVADAKAEREALLKNARAEGFAKGKAEGFEKGRAEGAAQGEAAARAALSESLSKMAASWAEAMDEFEGAREALLRESRVDLLRLSAAIASRVTRRTVELEPSVAAAQLEAVLDATLKPTRLRVRVHPNDLEVVEREIPALRARFAAAAHLELLADEAIEPGSVVSRSDKGEVDATIGTQLTRLIDALLPGEGARLAAPPQAQEAPAPDPPAEPEDEFPAEPEA